MVFGKKHLCLRIFVYDDNFPMPEGAEIQENGNKKAAPYGRWT